MAENTSDNTIKPVEVSMPDTDSEDSISSQPPKVLLEWKGNQIVSIADLGPAEEPDWLWPGFLARGSITLFSGLMKAGKTTLLKYLLRDLAKGGGLVEDPVVAPILIASEESSSEWARRRDKLDLPSTVLFLKRASYSRPNLSDWNDLIEKITEIVDRVGVGLVVFDTLPSAWPVLDENNASETISALNPLRGVAEAGAAVLLIHHLRKSDGSQGTGTRGSGALTGFVDIILELRRHNANDSSDTRRTLTAYGRYEGIPAETVVDLGPEGFTMLGDRVAVQQTDLTDSIAGLLPPIGKGRTVDELREAWPTSPKPGKARLLAALNAGIEVEAWMASGKGVKGDPRRFGRGDSPTDSIPFTPTPRGEPESNGIVELKPPCAAEGSDVGDGCE